MVTGVTASTRGAAAPAFVFALALALVVAFVFAGAAACTSFSADDRASDTAPAAGDAGDASVEAAAPDGAAAPDAGAGDDFCNAHHADPGFVYCNDFELPTSGSPPYGFSDVSATPSVTSVQVRRDGARRAVLEASVTSIDPGAHVISLAQLVGVGSDSMLPFVVDLDVKILAESEPSITAAAIHVAGAGCEGSFGLGVFDGTTVGGTRNRDPAPQPYVAGEWQHLTISVLKSDTSGTGYRELTVYGGVTLVDRDAHASNGGKPTACTRSDLTLGVTDTQGDPATIMLLFDNVLVRTP
jgi:hypothetical protein